MNISPLKAVIHKAVPDIFANWSGCSVCNMMCDACDAVDGDLKRPRPITLEDVLLTLIKVIDKQTADKDFRKGRYVSNTMLILSKWDLGKTLDNQKDETKAFLTDLLT